LRCLPWSPHPSSEFLAGSANSTSSELGAQPPQCGARPPAGGPRNHRVPARRTVVPVPSYHHRGSRNQGMRTSEENKSNNYATSLSSHIGAPRLGHRSGFAARPLPWPGGKPRSRPVRSAPPPPGNKLIKYATSGSSSFVVRSSARKAYFAAQPTGSLSTLGSFGISSVKEKRTMGAARLRLAQWVSKSARSGPAYILSQFTTFGIAKVR